MSIDYQDRLSDLYKALNEHCGVTDTQAIDILLSARVLPPHFPIVLETACQSADCTRQWFAFGSGDPVNTNRFRGTHWRGLAIDLDEEIRLVLRSREDICRLYIEPEYRTHRQMTVLCSESDQAVFLWRKLMSQCLRVRTEHPKHEPMSVAGLKRIHELTERVLDNRWRPEPLGVTQAEYEEIVEQAKALTQVCEFARDWDILCSNLATGLYRNVKHLTQSPERATAAVSRVIRDMIPVWTTYMLKQCTEREGGALFGHLEVGMSMCGTVRVTKTEIARLCSAGVLQYQTKTHKYKVTHEQYSKLVEA